MVSTGKTKETWQLFNVSTDYGEKTDVADKYPDIVKALSGEYDKWWATLPPYLVNEDAVPPKENPFKELFWKQFGKPKGK